MSGRFTDSVTRSGWKTLVWAVLLVVVVITLTPYLWMVLASFKNRVDLFASVPKWTFQPTLANYPAVFIDKNYWPLAINSLIISVSSTALCILIGAPAAYVFARMDFPGKEDLFFFFLTTRMAPPISIAVPLFLFFSALGLIDTIYAVVIAHTSFNLSLVVWMMRGFFADIPREIDEAAVMDGRSRLGAFVFIVMPLAAPGVAATAVLCFILSWNEFLYAFILVAFDGRPLTVGIPGLVTPHGTLWGQVAAVAIVATLPIIVFTFIVQRQLVRGLTFGAVKG